MAPHERLGTALGDDGGLEGLLAVRAWTTTPMCYFLCSVLRRAGRMRASVDPVLPYFRLFLSTLHTLPDRFPFKGGMLYRAESGAMCTWRAKKSILAKDEIVEHCFYVPTAFSTDLKQTKKFSDKKQDRTCFILHGAAATSCMS